MQNGCRCAAMAMVLLIPMAAAADADNLDAATRSAVRPIFASPAPPHPMDTAGAIDDGGRQRLNKTLPPCRSTPPYVSQPCTQWQR